MHPGSPLQPAPGAVDGPASEDDRYLVQGPRQVRRLLQALIGQRSAITAHVAGREATFLTAVLQADEDQDWILLDGSRNEASNRAAERASHLLCLAQLNRVGLRFRIEGIQRLDRDGQALYRAGLPTHLYYLQRRQCHRLETPITRSPTCRLRLAHDPGAQGDARDLRVMDIGAGGIALALPLDMPPPVLRQTCPDCLLTLPGQPPIGLPLTVCSLLPQAMPGGVGHLRVGMQFGALPRGAEALIQRYIFQLDRQRSACRNGAF